MIGAALASDQESIPTLDKIQAIQGPILVRAGTLRAIPNFFSVSGAPSFQTNHGEKVDGQDANQTKNCDDSSESDPQPTSAGNPIIMATGNKVETETDFTTTGEMPLGLSRTYNHYWNGAGL